MGEKIRGSDMVLPSRPVVDSAARSWLRPPGAVVEGEAIMRPPPPPPPPLVPRALVGPEEGPRRLSSCTARPRLPRFDRPDSDDDVGIDEVGPGAPSLCSWRKREDSAWSPLTLLAFVCGCGCCKVPGRMGRTFCLEVPTLHAASAAAIMA